MLKLGNSGNKGINFFFFLLWPYLLRSDLTERFHDFLWNAELGILIFAPRQYLFSDVRT